MGFTAMYLPEAAREEEPKRSSSAIFHVIKGSGSTIVDGNEISRKAKDTFSVPVFATLTHRADEEAFLMRVHDKPLQ